MSELKQSAKPRQKNLRTNESSNELLNTAGNG